MITRARAITTAATRTGAARRGIITFGVSARTTPIQKNTRAVITASVETHEAETDLGTMADGARGTVTITMMMEVEIAIESTIIMTIDIPEAGKENLAKAIAERCPA